MKNDGSRNWGTHLYRLAETIHGKLRWFRIDVTMKQGLPGPCGLELLTLDGAVKNMRLLIDRVNNRVFGHAHRKRGLALCSLASVERGQVGDRLHGHGLIEVPEEVSTSAFQALMDKQWSKCRWCYDRQIFVPLSDDDVEAWAGYVTKSGWQPDLIHIRKGSR